MCNLLLWFFKISFPAAFITEMCENISNNGNGSNNSSMISRFADYFVICGLDLDTGLEPDRFAGKTFYYLNFK